ncbi:MAG: GAF domain-containing SpoIIE family protein phosphatase [Candidatus Zixiibacteriota bacterium]
MDYQSVQIIACFLAGGFLAYLALLVVRDNLANRLNRVTGAMLLFAGVGPIVAALGFISQHAGATAELEYTSIYQLHLFWEFFFPLLVTFSWIFPIDRIRDFKHLRVRYLIYLPQIIHLLMVLTFDYQAEAVQFLELRAEEEGFSSIILRPVSKLASWLFLLIGLVRSYETTVFGGVHVLYVIIALYFLESGRQLVSNPRLLTQTRMVTWGTRLGGAVFTAAYLSATLFPRQVTDDWRIGLYLLALLVWSAFVIVATIRYQLLDVRLAFRQSFVFTITSALLVGVYIVVVLRAEKMLTPVFGEQARLVSYGFIIVVLLLFQPINNWIDDLIRSMFMRTRTDHRNILERFSRQVISLFDPHKLRLIIEETLKTSLLVERVHFVLFEDSIGEYAILPGEGNPKRIALSREDLMLRGINLLNTPTYLYSLSDYREDSALAAFLEEWRVRLVLPLKEADNLIGFVALSDKAAGYKYSSEDLNLLGVLSNQMVTALTNARLYVESMERMRLQEEMAMARQIQLDLLPSEPPCIPPFAISAHSTPSRTVGGDFYDFIPVAQDRLAVVIADASGKGMPAALMIAQIQAIIRSEVNNGSPIGTMLRNVNRQMLLSSSSEKYATLFYGELDTQQNRFCFANAGHNYPILVRHNGDVELLKEGGPVIGALPHMEYASRVVQIEPDDLLFLFTDGLSEAMDEQEREYGEDRICDLLVSHRSKQPDEIVSVILDDMKSFDPTDPPRDDTTIIAIKMNAGMQQ